VLLLLIWAFGVSFSRSCGVRDLARLPVGVLVGGGRLAVEGLRTTGCVAGRTPEGELDDLVEAKCHAVGVGLLELLIAEGGTCLVEAFLAAARVERIPPVSDLVR
jgi:hypothetical protein